MNSSIMMGKFKRVIVYGKNARKTALLRHNANSIVKELIDSFLDIVSRKFPNLILDQMTDTMHFVHL